MEANYFFIDGSALTAQIRQLQRAKPEFRKHRICPRKLIQYYAENLTDLLNGYYKRAIFYFPKGDETAIENYLITPDHGKPGEVRDLHFKFCGHKLKKSAEFDQWVEENVPDKWKSRFSKSEKGIDIEMSCDALRLASSSKLERLLLFTNDGDFIPLCRTIKEFGTNVSIIHLSSTMPPNLELLREADSYDVVSEDALITMFEPLPADPEESSDEGIEPSPNVHNDEPVSEKPEAEPSDLNMVIEEAEADEILKK